MGRGRPRKVPVTGMIMLKQTPDLPDEIRGDSVAEAVFLEACNNLIDRGALSAVHIPGLAVYAAAVADCWRIREIIMADGHVIENDRNGSRKSNPLWATLQGREATVKGYGEKFGLFPVDAEKIAKATDKDTNDLTDILDG